MRIPIVLRLFGYRRVCARAIYATGLLDICLRYSIGYSDFSCNEAGDISFCVPMLSVGRLQKLCRWEGVELTLLQGGGLPSLLWRYRRRAGLFAGGILALALLVLSGRFVWDVRVTGNGTMSAAQVKAELKSCGFGVGSYIPDIRTEELENRVLMQSDKISWISLYMDGTVAKVQVIEHITPPDENTHTRPANLVAERDGQIEYLQIYKGNCVVKVGQAVRAGELLVSGVYDSATEGVRFTRAAGEVMARTERVFTVKIPLSYTEKCYGEAEKGDRVLNFFDFSVNFFKNSGKEGEKYDIIREDRVAELWGGVRLPLYLTSVTLLPYTEQTRTHSATDALELAYRELDRELSALSAEAELLRKDVQTEIGDTYVCLTCTVACMENIAKQIEFDVEE